MREYFYPALEGLVVCTLASCHVQPEQELQALGEEGGEGGVIPAIDQVCRIFRSMQDRQDAPLLMRLNGIRASIVARAEALRHELAERECPDASCVVAEHLFLNLRGAANDREIYGC